MPKKLSFETVYSFFKDNGCTLLTTEYINNKQPLKFMLICGHIKISPYNLVKRTKIFECKNCHKNPLITYNEKRKFKKLQNVMETKINRAIKYKKDFELKNYHRVKICKTCGVKKQIMFFHNSNYSKDGKMRDCKICSISRNQHLRDTTTRKKHIKYLLNTCNRSAKNRGEKGREYESIFNLCVDDIELLIKKQNNKCCYTGRELNWVRNADNKASIDRIDSTKGYILENV